MNFNLQQNVMNYFDLMPNGSMQCVCNVLQQYFLKLAASPTSTVTSPYTTAKARFPCSGRSAQSNISGPRASLLVNLLIAESP